MDNCIKCIHNEVCLYIWKFTFKGTSSRKEIYRDLYVKKHCGHYLESEKLSTEDFRVMANAFASIME